MKFDSFIVVAEKSDFENESGFVNALCFFNMRSCDNEFLNLFNEKSSYYFYAPMSSTDGFAKITEDEYGNPLAQATPEKVINFLENIKKNENFYRRYSTLLATLKDFQNNPNWNLDNIIIIHAAI